MNPFNKPFARIIAMFEPFVLQFVFSGAQGAAPQSLRGDLMGSIGNLQDCHRDASLVNHSVHYDRTGVSGQILKQAVRQNIVILRFNRNVAGIANLKLPIRHRLARCTNQVTRVIDSADFKGPQLTQAVQKGARTATDFKNAVTVTKAKFPSDDGAISLPILDIDASRTGIEPIKFYQAGKVQWTGCKLSIPDLLPSLRHLFSESLRLRNYETSHHL